MLNFFKKGEMMDCEKCKKHHDNCATCKNDHERCADCKRHHAECDECKKHGSHRESSCSGCCKHCEK